MQSPPLVSLPYNQAHGVLQLEEESVHTILIDSVQGLSMVYHNVNLPRDQRAKHKKDTLPHFHQDEEGPPATFGLLHSAPAARSQDAVTTTALNKLLFR